MINEKLFKMLQNNMQNAAQKCSSICNSNPNNSNQGFFCFHAMKYDVTYPVLFFGMEMNVKKNRQDHLTFEMVTK